MINEQRSTTQKCAGRPLLFYSLIFEIAHCLADNTVQYGVLTNDLVNYTQGIESYFRNERLTLRDKINKFIEELPESYRELLSEHVGNTDDWIGKLVSTRVFLTHGDRENMAVSNPYKLVQMTKIFGFMVRIFILQKLGITIDKPKILNKFKNVLTTHYY